MKKILSRNDTGFTLVELSVYIVVLGILSGIVAAVMPTLFKSEQTVSGLTSAANDSQTTEYELRADVRNARELRVSQDGRSLVASVAGENSAQLSWNCVKWNISGGADPLTLTRSQKTDQTGQAYPSPVPKITTLLSQVPGETPVAGTSFFIVAGAAQSVQKLSYVWPLQTNESGAVIVTGDISTRPQASDESDAQTTCFTDLNS